MKYILRYRIYFISEHKDVEIIRLLNIIEHIYKFNDTKELIELFNVNNIIS